MEKDTFQEFKGVSYEQWKQLAEKALKGKSIDSLLRKTYENVVLKPLYTKGDAIAFNQMAALFPQNREGIAQEISGKSPSKANAVLVNALQGGQQVLHLLVDKATLRGTDSTELNVEKDRGIPLSFKEDFESVFNGVTVEKYPFLLYTGAIGSPLLAMLLSYVEGKGISSESIRGTIGADPIGFLAEEGELYTSLDACYDDLVNTVRWSQQNAPKLKTIFVRTDVYHNAGANAVQETAAALATAVEYVRAGVERGLEAKDVISHITFSFSVGSHLYSEIAKLRAIRVLWGKVVEQFGVVDEEAFIHVRTSKRTKTEYDPYINLLRSTTEAFSAIVGGADTLHVSAYDDATEFAHENGERWARNIQHILREEAHLEKIVDPARGSFYIEALTNEIAKQAWELFRSIENKGGMSAVLQDGSWQKEINRIAIQRLANVRSLKQSIIGSNQYVNLDEEKLVAENSEDYNRSAELAAFKNKRNDSTQYGVQGKATIDELIRAFSNGSTIGEVTAAWKENGIKVQALVPMRDAEPFEELRKTAEQFENQKGRRPKALIVQLQENEKTKSIASTLKACGFEAVTVKTLPSEVQNDVEAVFVYDLEESLRQSVIQLSAKAKKVYVIGKYENDLEEAVLQAGASGLLPDISSLLPLLHELYNELEVTV